MTAFLLFYKERQVGELYTYDTLEQVPFHAIAPCLNRAFSDYAVPIRLEEAELPGFFAASGIEKKRSFGAFLDGQLVGFLFCACQPYQGRSAAFAVGAGVVPEHRGKGAFTGLFALAEQRLKQISIEACYLEVLQQNEPAITLYQRLGFSVTRELMVLHAVSDGSTPVPEGVNFAPFTGLDLAEGCRRVRCSFEHSDHVLMLHPEQYEIAYPVDDMASAYCIFSKENGSLCQLGYRSLADLRMVIQALLGRYSSAVAKNIDSGDTEILNLLASLGFQTVAKQFEMAKSLR